MIFHVNQRYLAKSEIVGLIKNHHIQKNTFILMLEQIKNMGNQECGLTLTNIHVIWVFLRFSF